MNPSDRTCSAPARDEALLWFRRDPLDFDHAALHAALNGHRAMHCAFVFDTKILDALDARADRRVTLMWDSVHELKAALTARGAGLHVLYGRARNEIPRLARRLGVAAAYANRDDEPQAIARDVSVAERLREAGIDLRTCKDQVIFELSVIASPSCAFWDLNLQAMSLMPAPYGRSVKRSSGAGCALGEKSAQPHYGYKNHINIDQATKLIAAQTCTDASVHDSQVLKTRATR